MRCEGGMRGVVKKQCRKWERKRDQVWAEEQLARDELIRHLK